MSLRRIKHALLRLRSEEKVIGAGALIVLISAFMPWYSVIMSYDKKSITETGFSGDLGVVGFIVFLMSLMAILVLVGENLRIPMPQFGYKKEQILFFLMGQNAFLVLLTIAIYTKRSLEFTNAELRFGIFAALIGAFFGAFAAFALAQKTKKQAVTEFFSHDEEGGEPEEQRVQIEEEELVMVTEEPEPEEEPEEEPPKPEPENKPSFFEDEELKEVAEEEAERESGEIPEDEMIEDVSGAREMAESSNIPEEIEEEPEEPQDEKNQEAQGDYFAKEAGLEPDDEEVEVKEEEEETEEESEEPDDESEEPDDEEKKRSSGLGMNFYEDQ